MGVIARAKSFFGRGGAQLSELPQVAVPVLPQDQSVFTVTGTTGITSFSLASGVNPGRHVLLIGTHATGPALTDTALSGTANGLIHTVGSRTIGLGKSILLVQMNNGSWWEVPAAGTAVG